MPSVRTLAEELLANANTIVKAYAELVRDGALESHQGKGFLSRPSVRSLLMFALQEWPARIPCRKCNCLRVGTLETCERCGAARELPAPDGTEIFETAKEEVTFAVAHH
jgi:DNA-binding transcriptional MocR family regulator